MSSEWAKNLVGLRLSDFEMLRVPNPRTELTLHVTTKTVQAGTLIGSLLVGPLQAALKGGVADGANLKAKCAEAGIQGALIGLVAGPILTAIATGRDSQLKVYDRCYRIRFNDNQLRADRASLVGGGVGAALAGPPGFVAGVDIGLIAAAAYNRLFA